MKHILIGISGFSGVGKDEVAKRLVDEHQAIHTGFVDSAKRHMADVYGFSRSQLFGPSSNRNKGDIRYPKELFFKYKLKLFRDQIVLDDNMHACMSRFLPNTNYYYFDSMIEPEGIQSIPGWPQAPFYIDENSSKIRYFIPEGHPTFWLSPREALQEYCEKMDSLYPYTWVRRGIDDHLLLVIRDSNNYLLYQYDPMIGIQPREFYTNSQINGDIITCFSNIRFKSNIQYIRESSDNGKLFFPIIIRVKRPGIEKPPFQHISETEQATIPDSEFDFVVNNNGTVSNLYDKIDTIIKNVKSMNTSIL